MKNTFVINEAGTLEERGVLKACCLLAVAFEIKSRGHLSGISSARELYTSVRVGKNTLRGAVVNITSELRDDHGRPFGAIIAADISVSYDAAYAFLVGRENSSIKGNLVDVIEGLADEMLQELQMKGLRVTNPIAA